MTKRRAIETEFSQQCVQHIAYFLLPKCGEFNCYKPSFKNMLHNDPMRLCVHAVEIRFQINIHKSRNIT